VTPAGGPAVVAMGGGHGLAASLGALRLLTDRLTAVVTVADDGGSSGRLRAELPGLLPPGDLRMALCALAADDEVSQQWARLLQHRFPGDPGTGGGVAGHAVGNLLLAGLLDTIGDPVVALDRVAALVGAAGRVLPLAAEPLTIEADVIDAGGAVRTVSGQVAVATTTGRVTAVRVVPADPAVSAETLTAVRGADWVVLGPGSLFSSQLPHLLVPALADALRGGSARTAYLLNLVGQPGETEGFSPAAHLEALVAHAPALRLALVLADADAVPADGAEARDLAAAAARLGATVVRATVAVPGEPGRHDPRRLADALRPHLSHPGGPPVATRQAGPSAGAAGRVRAHESLGRSVAWRR